MILAIRAVLNINRVWDRSRAWTRLFRFSALLLSLALPLNSFAQAHLLSQRPFRATEDQRSGGDHICDLRRDGNGDGIPDRLGDYVCISGTIIAGPFTYEQEGSLFWIRNKSCGMLVYGNAEPLRVGDSVTVDGRLRSAGRGRIFRQCGLEALEDCGVKKTGAVLRGINPAAKPLPVTLREYCAYPGRYAGNLVSILAPIHLSRPVASGPNLLCWAGDGRDSLVLYLDRDTGIELDSDGNCCYAVTGISMKMHLPREISSIPQWCLAPRSQEDAVRLDCSTGAQYRTWGSIKAEFSD